MKTLLPDEAISDEKLMNAVLSLKATDNNDNR